MSPAPDMAKGWTLQQALPFASEPTFQEHFRALEARFIGKDAEEAADLRERVELAFEEAMRNGGLSAWGVPASGGQPIEIPARVWGKGALADFSASSVAYVDGGTRHDLRDVRLFPWLHLPDVPQRMHGLSLPEAFRRFVRNDLQVIDRARWASIAFIGKYCASANQVTEGWFTERHRLWPAMLEDYDLVVEWMDGDQGSYAHLEPARKRGAFDWIGTQGEDNRKAFAAVRAAEAVVRDRFERFMAPLRFGTVEVTGQLRDGSAPATLALGIWSRPRTRIDFVDGEVHRLAEAEVRENAAVGYMDRIETTSLEWTALTLRCVDVVPAPAPAPEPRDLGGAPETHAWSQVYDRLVVRLARDGFPGTGKKGDLALLMLDCFDEAGAPQPTQQSVSRWLRKHHPIVWLAAGRDGEV